MKCFNFALLNGEKDPQLSNEKVRDKDSIPAIEYNPNPKVWDKNHLLQLAYSNYMTAPLKRVNALSLLDNVEMKHQGKVQTMFFVVLFTFSSGLERERERERGWMCDLCL